MLLCCLSLQSHSLVLEITRSVKSSGNLQCVVKKVLVSCHMVKFKAVISKYGEVGKPDLGSEFTFIINYIFILISCIVLVLQKIALYFQFESQRVTPLRYKKTQEFAFCV